MGFLVLIRKQKRGEEAGSNHIQMHLLAYLTERRRLLSRLK
jgi:hypothetical protein